MAQRVSRDEEKRNLPSQGGRYKSVKKSGMGDRRRIISADQVKHEVERRDDQDAPNARDPENDLCKSHDGSRIALCYGNSIAWMAGKSHSLKLEQWRPEDPHAILLSLNRSATACQKILYGHVAANGFGRAVYNRHGADA